MRFFIALEIPDQSKEELKKVQEKLKLIIPTIRLSKENKLHLTIAFVGEQPESLKDRLIEAMSKAVSRIPEFEVTPAYIDAFPSLHHSPHIIWSGVKGDIDKLMILRERVKDNLETLNLAMDERRFTPHITLGKVTDFEITPAIEEDLQNIIPKDLQPIHINSIKLFESVPDEDLHTHNTLAEVFLHEQVCTGSHLDPTLLP